MVTPPLSTQRHAPPEGRKSYTSGDFTEVGGGRGSLSGPPLLPHAAPADGFSDTPPLGPPHTQHIRRSGVVITNGSYPLHHPEAIGLHRVIPMVLQVLHAIFTVFPTLVPNTT